MKGLWPMFLTFRKIYVYPMISYTLFKKIFFSATCLVLLSGVTLAQTANRYEISFPNAVHHEAEVSITFPNITDRMLEVRMSRASPGRYAIHEFAKNVYNVKATDSEGNDLPVTRPNPYAWQVAGHDGTVTFSYTIFGDRGDGTYFQVDETHAHLNMPAVFAFAPSLGYRPVQITFNTRDDLNWKVATQLEPVTANTFRAPDLSYFMDSLAEISDFILHEFEEESNGKTQTIRIALHHTLPEPEADKFFAYVEQIVREQKQVMGGLPDFDYGTYTFLVCNSPQASGDGMEHRNSTYVVDTRPLRGDGVEAALGTMSHEFFHCWNVERIRPATLKPFDFTQANMSDELWFAEGFTSYYTDLTLCRAGIISPQAYVEGLARSLNYVTLRPGRKFHSPIEMSRQAPFVDAARSIDPFNTGNVFTSYYTYGKVLGLALDLSLRNLGEDHTLDGFMQQVWRQYGKTEVAYTVTDLQAVLGGYTSEQFAGEFFSRFIFSSSLPDYKELLETVGVVYQLQNPGQAYLGVSYRSQDSTLRLTDYPRIATPAYKAGLDKNDTLLALNGKELSGPKGLQRALAGLKPLEKVSITYQRLGKEKETGLVLQQYPNRNTVLMETLGNKPNKSQQQQREAWLSR